MDNPSYKYDVAFSFLAEDEAMAAELNGLVSDRVSTFLYSCRQEELAGTDGLDSFTGVFATEARTVVVLHRVGWGETPWTRIESTAIRNRAYEEGFAFCLFIPVALPPALPDWVPRTEIWVGLDRWGSTGAASVIEARVQAAGGAPRTETAVEKATRLDRDIQAEQERHSFLASQAGVDAAQVLRAELFADLERIVEDINGKTTSSELFGVRNRDGRSFYLRGGGLSVTVAWSQQYGNSLNYSSLHVWLWDGPVAFDGRVAFRESVKLQETDFDVDVARSGVVGWREADADGRVLSSHQLADRVVQELLDAVPTAESE